VTRSALPRIGLLALIWGSAFLWIKLADRGFWPVEVTLARLALGAAVLFAIVLARREKVPRSPRLWVHMTVAALFGNAVPYLLFAVAEQHVDSSTAGVINATTPLWPEWSADRLCGPASLPLPVGLTSARTGGRDRGSCWPAVGRRPVMSGPVPVPGRVKGIEKVKADRFLGRRGTRGCRRRRCGRRLRAGGG
jgi:EamA-like transporter family